MSVTQNNKSSQAAKLKQPKTQTKENFSTFAQKLELALQKEVQRREALQKTISVVTNNSERAECPEDAQKLDRSYNMATAPQKTLSDSDLKPPTAEDEQLVSEQLKQISEDRLANSTPTPYQEPRKPAYLYKETTKKMKQSILRKIDHMLPQTLLKKSQICQHDHGCFENIFRRALKFFLIGFGLQMLIKNILLVIKPAKLIRNLTKGRNLTDCTRFGLFLMCFNTAYKFVLCLMRRLGCLNDKVNAPVAGFFSAMSLAIDTGSRRQLLTILTMSRAIETSFNIGESSGTIPSFKARNLLLWLLANCFLQALMSWKQGALNGSLRKFFMTWSQMKQNDQILIDVWSKMYADGVPSF